MTIDGKLGTLSHDMERARAGEPAIILGGKVKSDQGELPVGLVITKNSDEEFIPYEEVDNEVLGTGDDATAAFAGTLAKAPAEPGSVVITDGTESFSDDGLGRLTGDAGGSGTVNYDSGAVSVTFNANVANGVNVVIDYVTRIDGVMDSLVDTAKHDAATYVHWGKVRRDVLKVGATTKAAAGTTLLKRMQKRGLYAV